MVFHNVTYFEGNVTFLNLVQGTNNVVNNWVGITILLMVTTVLFMVLLQKNQGFKESIVASCWVSMLLAILMYPIQIISGTWLIGSIVITAFATLSLWLSD